MENGTDRDLQYRTELERVKSRSGKIMKILVAGGLIFGVLAYRGGKEFERAYTTSEIRSTMDSLGNAGWDTHERYREAVAQGDSLVADSLRRQSGFFYAQTEPLMNLLRKLEGDSIRVK